MKNSKLFELIYVLTASEKKEFLLFIASTLFNTNNELIEYYKIILGKLKEQDELKKEELWALQFPNKIYNAKALSYINTDLTKLLEQFILIKEINNKESIKLSLLLDFFQDKNLSKNYKSLKTKLKKEKDKKKTYNFLFQKQVHHIEILHNGKNKKRKRFDPSLGKANDHLDNYYLFWKLKYFCMMLNLNRHGQEKYYLSYRAQIVSVLENDKIEIYPTIEIYHTIFTLLSTNTPSRNIFSKLKKQLKTHSPYLHSEEIYEVFQYAINICIRHFSKSEALDLYIFALEKNYFLKNKILSTRNFNNAIYLAILEKRYNLVEDLIDKYNHLLPEDERENAKNYNYGDLYFKTKNYDKALTHLNKLNRTDINYHIRSRETLAMIFYEIGEEDSLLSLLASFTIYLKRNKHISTNIKLAFLNFCDLLNRILRRNPKKHEALGEKIRNTKVVSNKIWLIEIWEREKKNIF